MLKYEILAPPAGHHGEMRMKGLVKAPPADSSQSQPVEDPWRPGGRAEGKASTCGLLSVTKSSVSASGSHVSLPQGKDQISRIAHKDRITRKCRTHWAGAALFSKLLAFTKPSSPRPLHQDLFTKISLPRDQCRRLSQILLWGREALNPKGCRAAAQKLPPGLEAHWEQGWSSAGTGMACLSCARHCGRRFPVKTPQSCAVLLTRLIW